ncbi:MAG: bamB, partial [Nevskia sp.]|nr:bamB [Nevskia sp.]
MRGPIRDMGRTGALIAACVLLAVAGCGHKGKLKLPSKLVDIKNPQIVPHDVWSSSVGKGSGKFYTGLQVSVDVDALYVAEIGGAVYALDPKTGKQIWRTRTKAKVISGPTESGDLVLVGTSDGFVIALKRANGQQAWRSQASSEVLAAPVGSGNTVVVKAGDGREYGLDANSGERRWSFDRNVPNLTLRGLSAPLIVGNRVYVGFDSGKLVALNLADGA